MHEGMNGEINESTTEQQTKEQMNIEQMKELANGWLKKE
jgi:hypothetical protein